MWGPLLVAAFAAAFDPIRLAVVFLVISRPRPVRNLIAYTVGCLAACSYMLVLPLMVLNFADAGRFDGTGMSHTRVWVGVGALVMAAALLAVRFRPATFAAVLISVGERAPRFWDRGGLWTSAGVGAAIGGPPWDAVVLLFAMILVTGATVGTQVVAAVALVAVMLAVVEVILVAHLVNPGRAQAGLRRASEWITGHRRQCLAGISALAGVTLIAGGLA
ncbi:hypothetical protein DQP55_10265 [Mycolicibacterium sp. GF69]|uniref:GAP family protein n=1 Tax=Mycolicibacterium sp. GF69 TaxID=2267251 RepID=UPI000DCF4BD0|nr:GAP family protein [Mycolicibacterium sp. GF69]RAV13548.1 hypothetical protein DQP55_10265 [Mycolicibacterium sp. GF69]